MLVAFVKVLKSNNAILLNAISRRYLGKRCACVCDHLRLTRRKERQMPKTPQIRQLTISAHPSARCLKSLPAYFAFDWINRYIPYITSKLL